MIYIITPYMSDFRRVCIDNQFPYSNGKSRRDIVWVYSVEQLYGRKIGENDRVIKGYEYIHFPTKVIDRFEVEIVMRQK